MPSYGIQKRGTGRAVKMNRGGSIKKAGEVTKPLLLNILEKSYKAGTISKEFYKKEKKKLLGKD